MPLDHVPPSDCEPVTDEDAVEEEALVGECVHCHCDIHEGEEYSTLASGYVICEECRSDHSWPCERCGKLHYDDDLCISVRVGCSSEGSDEQVCEDCFDSLTTTRCALCGTYVEPGEDYSCETVHLRGSSEEDWCLQCRTERNVHCCTGSEDEDGDFQEHEPRYLATNREQCPVCAAPNPNFIPPIRCSPLQPGTVRAPSTSFDYMFSYHDGNRPRMRRPNTDELCIGFEFEVAGPDFRRQGKELLALGITPEMIHPERDATVDVEWVSQPIPMSKVWDFVRNVCRGLRKGGATAYDSSRSCGCHHNVDKNYLSTSQWDTVVRAVHKYYATLACFSGRSRSLDGYTKDVVDLEHAVRSGKHCSVSFRKDYAVEIRLPGMTLSPNMMATQVTLYYNLLTNIKKGAGVDDPFEALFGPFTDEMLKCLHRKGITKDGRLETPAASAAAVEPIEEQLTFDREFGHYQHNDVVRVRPTEDVRRLLGGGALCPGSLDYVTCGITEDLAQWIVANPGHELVVSRGVRDSMGFDRAYNARLFGRSVRMPVLEIMNGIPDLPGRWWIPTLLFEPVGFSMDTRIPRDRVQGQAQWTFNQDVRNLFSGELRDTQPVSPAPPMKPKAKLPEDQLTEEFNEWPESEKEDNNLAPEEA